MRISSYARRFIALALAFALAAAPVIGKAGSAQAKKSISLKSKKASIFEGESVKIKVKNAPKGAKVTYKSNDKTVATVSKKGVVKAKSEGDTKIIVKVKKKKKLLKKLTFKVSVMSDNQETPNPTETPYKPEVKEKFKGDRKAKLSDDFITQTNDFSVNLVRTCGAGDIKDGKNVLISPLSVLTDMMMAANGANTTTLAEMEKVMCGGVGFTDFRTQLSNMNAGLIYSDKVKFHMANSIWLIDDKDRIQVKDDFLDQGEIWYNADSYVLPFDEAMVAKVNEWVNKNTLGMIPKLLDKAPDPTEVMHLINALAFEGNWADPYEDYSVLKNQEFTNHKGEKEKVNMLCEGIEKYLHDDKAYGFAKPYKGYDFSFVAILPNEGVSVSDYLAGMDGKSFKDFYNSTATDCDVNTRIPEFNYDYDTSLADGIKKMGIEEAFTDKADFSGMADTKTGKLFIGDVHHKTHIELDKNGTKAAAVTDIVMKDSSSSEPVPKKVLNIYLDRPFIYAIVQTSTGIPIFMGAVNSVNDK